MSHLLRQDNPKPEQIQNLKILHFSGENLLVLINDILDFSKIEAGKITFEKVDFSLPELISGIRQSFLYQADEKGLRVRARLDSNLPDIIIGDPVRLNQIISNLLSNAIKFTAQGAITVDVTLEQETNGQEAVSDQIEPITFYQFPMQFSEYNSRDVAQYTPESWFQKYTPEAITVPAVTIDFMQSQYILKLKLIKIDVEGGELQVIAGAEQTLRQQAPTVVMEYLSPSRNNQVHQQAYELLRQFGYQAYIILANGSLTPCSDPDRHLQTRQLDSDNLIFQK